VIYDAKEGMLEGGTDRRASDGAAIGVSGRGAQKQTSAARYKNLELRIWNC
jgi:hypothetical protein